MDRVRHLRIDDLSMHKKENPSTAKQLLSQIQELQDNVNAMSEESPLMASPLVAGG